MVVVVAADIIITIVTRGRDAESRFMGTRNHTDQTMILMILGVGVVQQSRTGNLNGRRHITVAAKKKNLVDVVPAVLRRGAAAAAEAVVDDTKDPSTDGVVTAVPALVRPLLLVAVAGVVGALVGAVGDEPRPVLMAIAELLHRRPLRQQSSSRRPPRKTTLPRTNALFSLVSWS
jgi:hypothetical protein